MDLTFHYRGPPKAGTSHKMLSVPFFFSTSRFQGPAFHCDKIVVIVTLLEERMEGIPDKDYNFLGNDKFPNLYERLLYKRKLKSGYLERRIYERPLRSEPFYRESKRTYFKTIFTSISYKTYVYSLRFLKHLKNKSSMLKTFLFKRISLILIPKS